MNRENEVKIWDPFVRLSHWFLAAAFLLSYVTAGHPRWLHVYSGYFITVLVVLRIIWGFVGPKYARFSNFVKSSREILSYLKDLVLLRAKRHLGHDPAGGAMILLLLVFLSFTVLSGMMVHGVKDKAGPFAAANPEMILSNLSFSGVALAESERHEREEAESGGWLGEAHEIFAKLTLLLVIVHLFGVLVVSLGTRENLVRSMITGRKRPIEEVSDDTAKS